MEKGLYSAISGSMAQERAMEIITNNLANVASTGFKADRVVFESYLQKQMDPKADVPTPEEIKRGDFSKRVHDTSYQINSENYTDFSQGPLKLTDRPFDISLDGDGMFVVKTPDGERYTRGGSFEINLDGELTTSSGLQVMDVKGKPVYIGSGEINIMDNGTITTPEGVAISRIKVVAFEDKSLLRKEGAGLFKSNDPKQAIQSDALVKQGFLEGSNINPVAEMTRMITVQRTYQALQKAVQSQDEMTGRLIADVGRP